VVLEATRDDGIDLCVVRIDPKEVVELHGHSGRRVILARGPRPERRGQRVVPPEVVEAHATVYARGGRTIRRMGLSIAAWGIAAAGLVLLGAAGPAYRLGVSLGHAFDMVRWAAATSLTGAALSVGALLWSRRKARTGAAIVAGIGVLLGILSAAVGYGWLRQAQAAPALHDLTTDLENPPTFEALAKERPAGSNPFTRSRDEDQLQRQHYPDLAPVIVAQPSRLVFDRARLVAHNQGWTIVASDPDAGRLEATDTTRWFGFTDDIVVRLVPWGTGTRVDVRSASRYGSNDTGTNARRIRRFLSALQAP
jgi:uncharacterized protein (DUF1499 family)